MKPKWDTHTHTINENTRKISWEEAGVEWEWDKRGKGGKMIEYIMYM